MRKIEVDHLNIGEDKFPVYCDLRVLEEIQDKYGSISEYERLLMGWEIVRDPDGEPVRKEDGTIEKKAGDPSAKVILESLMMMIKEGQRIEQKYGAAEGSYTDEVTMEDLETMPLNGLTLFTLSQALHLVFMKCFSQKKSDEKPITTKKKRTSK